MQVGRGNERMVDSCTKSLEVIESRLKAKLGTPSARKTDQSVRPARRHRSKAIQCPRLVSGDNNRWLQFPSACVVNTEGGEAAHPIGTKNGPNCSPCAKAPF